MAVQDLLKRHRKKPCPYCGQIMHRRGRRRPTRDHIWPRIEGGTLEDFNRVIVCEDCNNDKGRLPLREWQAKLHADDDPRSRHVAAFVERLRSTVPSGWVDRFIGRWPDEAA